MDERLQNNTQLLATRFPAIVSELRNANIDRSSLADTHSWLTDGYGPEPKRKDLLQRWVALAPKEPFRILVTTGIGDGSHVRELLQTLPHASSVVALECDPSQLMMSLIHGDLSDVLGDPRFILLTPYSYRDGVSGMGDLLIGNRGCVLFPYQPLRLKSPSLYDNMLGMVMRQLLARANQVCTEIDLAEMVFTNTVQNFAKIGTGSDIRAINGSCMGIPMVLVAAGPSLDGQLDFLHAVQGKALIVVVNSAFRAVTRAGVIPDITVAVDPKEFTAMGYRDCPVKNTHLVCSFQVYPEVVAMFEQRVFPISSVNAVATRLKQVLQLPEDPPMIGDGTVSSTVVNLAAWMGCSEIYLVGQDLAIRPDGQTHVTDSFYSDYDQNFFDIQKCQWVPGNSGELVPVEPKLMAYLRILENLVSHYSAIRFFNLSPAGARIHGVPFLSADEAASRLKELPVIDFQGLIASRAALGRYPEGIRESLHKVFSLQWQFLEQIVRSLLKFAVQGEMNAEIQKECPHTLAPEHPIAEAWNEVILSLQKNRLFDLLLQEGRTKREIRSLVWKQSRWSPLTAAATPIGELLPHAWALIEGALFQIEVISRNFSLRKPDAPTERSED